MVSCGTMRATVLLIAEPPRIPPRVQEGQVLVLPSVGAVFARAAEASANASAQWPVPVGGCVRVGRAYTIPCGWNQPGIGQKQPEIAKNDGRRQ